MVPSTWALLDPGTGIMTQQLKIDHVMQVDPNLSPTSNTTVHTPEVCILCTGEHHHWALTIVLRISSLFVESALLRPWECPGRSGLEPPLRPTYLLPFPLVSYARCIRGALCD